MKRIYLNKFVLAIVALLISNLAFANFVWDENEKSGLKNIDKMQKASGIKFFWWNIMGGRLSKANEIEQNLKYIISDAVPDILALGEYRDNVLTKTTNELLEASYPHHYFFFMDS